MQYSSQNKISQLQYTIAIERILTSYRNRVIVVPTGNYDSIVEVVMRKAGTHPVSDTDSGSLVEFWKQIYDITILPDEIPLLRVRMVNSEATFTYPPKPKIFKSSYKMRWNFWWMGNRQNNRRHQLTEPN